MTQAGTDAHDQSDTLLEVLGAVDYLADGHRPELSVWDALEEALRWWVAAHLSPDDSVAVIKELPWDDPDPLRTSIESALATVGPAGIIDGHALSDVFDAALRGWLRAMSDRFNQSQPFRLRPMWTG
jgi:hypothetical protein